TEAVADAPAVTALETVITGWVGSATMLTVAFWVTLEPAPVTVRVKVVFTWSNPVLTGTPLPTGPIPLSTVPWPLLNTAVMMVLWPAVMELLAGTKALMAGPGVELLDEQAAKSTARARA